MPRALPALPGSRGRYDDMYTDDMAQPLVHRYLTYDDLCRLPPDGNRYELFDGEVHLAPSPNTRHQEIVFRLALAFRSAIQDRSRLFLSPLDVVFAPATALQPDLLLIREERREIVRDVVRGAPDLVIEVLSSSTAELDRRLKKEIYARHGVGECWIVDGAASTIEIQRLDRETGAYRLAETCRPGGRATTPLLPALSIDVREIFADLD